MTTKRRRRRFLAGPPRKRKRTVTVHAYCRRGATSAYKKAEAMRRSMPF